MHRRFVLTIAAMLFLGSVTAAEPKPEVMVDGKKLSEWVELLQSKDRESQAAGGSGNCHGADGRANCRGCPSRIDA